MIKKYFKEEKAHKGEVINTKSGHQIRASVKISLVMLDPVFFKYFSHQTLSSTNHHGVVSALLEEDVYATVGVRLPEFLSSVLTFMILLLQLNALTEEAVKHRLKTMDQLSWRKKIKNKKENCCG